MKIKKLWQFIAAYLDLNKSERRGLVILMSIILLIIIVRFFLPVINIDESLSTTLEITETNFDTLATLLSNKEEKKYNYNNCNNYKTYSKKSNSNNFTKNQLKPFNFNPNDISKEQWIKIGFTEKQAELIQNYKNGGGKFITKEDVAKLWCINNEDYNILEPYILLPSKNDSNFKPTFSKTTTYNKKPIINNVEINTASEEELMSVPGIGKYYASQIIKLKNKLGGFYSVEQLMEINRMDTSKFNKISPYIIINKKFIRKININMVGLDELRKHPYFTFNISLALINYRDRHGKFQKIEDIRKCDLITEEIFIKLLPYISVE